MTMEEMEKRVQQVIKIINGIEERLNTLLEYGMKTKNMYIIGFVNGLCDFINKEMEELKE